MQALTGLITLIFYKQEHFTLDEKDYPHIGENPNKLVVYFSRMGYTKSVALAEANSTGAELYEIKSTEKTDGTLGFWWCGRFGMHRWNMPIEKVNIDFSNYEKVTICTPIWVFHISAPMRAFCNEVKGKIKKADYIFIHFQNVPYKNAEKEMNEILGINAQNVTSICCHKVKIISIKKIKSNSEQKIKNSI